MDQLDVFLADAALVVDSALDHFVPPESQEPARLHSAMRWSLFGNGKRLRPALTLAVGRQFGASDSELEATAAAIEMTHTYSLIHDDLPAMDDDDLRRGRATCHKKFDEATAILAGDALQALAFQIIAEDEQLASETRIELLAGLGGATSKMVAGQQMDLEAEGKDLSVDQIEIIHRNKTGALIRFSAVAGAIIGDASEAELAVVSHFGEKLGLLFQISDDLLDVTQSTETLGKTAAKDVHAAKATYPGVLGVDETRKRLADAHLDVVAEVEKLKGPSPLLEAIADLIVRRQS